MEALAREGAASVFRSIARTAERVPDGVRWRTLSYLNQDQYDTSLFNGVAGVTLFLSDYARAFPDAEETQEALDLAEGGLRWCTAPARPPSLAPLGTGSADPHSLWAGSAGLGLAWLRLAGALRQAGLEQRAAGALREASAQGDRVARSAPGPWTEFGRGAAGEGFFLVRLWQATSNPVHLGGALTRGVWLREHALEDGRGCHWLRVLEPDNPRARARTGWTVGSAGIGTFLLALFEATGDPRWASLVQDAAGSLLAEARPDHQAGAGLGWPYVFGGGEDLARCQWCVGAPGIGAFFAAAHRLLGDPAYLEAARRAAEATYAHGDVRGNPSVCHGLAGSAEVFLALHRVTGEPEWLGRTEDFARRCLTYRSETPEGDRWQADAPGLSSPDFLCGAAGTGHLFLRLAAYPRLQLPFA